MKPSKLTLAIAAILTASFTTSAFAIVLYVDNKTKQLYTEAGPGRQILGSFEQVQEGSSGKTGQSEVTKLQQDLELQNNQIKALEEHAKEAHDEGVVEIKKDGGIEFKSRDGNFKMAINGRMQVDSQVNAGQSLPGSGTPVGGVYPGNGFVAGAGAQPATLNDGVGLRRGRLGIEGTFFKNTEYKFEYDFTRGNGTTGAGVTDAFLKYNFSKPLSIKFGSFKEPFSMEEATSNRYLTFIERNMMVNTFVDNLNTYKLGVGANYAEDRWQVAGSVQTEPVGNNGGTANDGGLTGTNSNGGSNRSGGTGDTSWEANARVSGRPWMQSNTQFLHVGTSGSYMNINNNYHSDGAFSNGGISFANGIGGNVDRTNILNTSGLTKGVKGAVAGWAEVQHMTRFGAESAVVYGPFSAQGEYIRTDLSGSGYKNESLSGYYGYVSYFLTGESRNYKASTGAWDRIKPTHNFDMKDGWGAWEIATGYDYLNLNSGIVNGGRASTAKVGLNWYVNPHVRLMADYIHALDINTGAVANATSKAFNNASLDLIETRVQIDW